MKETIDAQYTRLCQELGDIEFKIFQLQKQSQEIKQKISAFDGLVPSLIQISDLRKAAVLENRKNDSDKA